MHHNLYFLDRTHFEPLKNVDKHYVKRVHWRH